MKTTAGEKVGMVIVALLFVSLIAGVSMGYAELVYGDWRCAFADCRLVKE